jgi:hypothetical protein
LFVLVEQLIMRQPTRQQENFLPQKTARRIVLGGFLCLILWIAVDLTLLRPKHSLRAFDPVAVARLDAEMWRSYYERKPMKLFGELAELMRSQYGAPFWQSWLLAGYAGRAAFVFKDGHNRQDYNRALPYLRNFYTGINRLEYNEFDVEKVANLELEWWIIRREKARFAPADWERILANEAAELYHLPAQNFRQHARLRVSAMVLRDSLGDEITERDWQRIQMLLGESWKALQVAVKNEEL